MCQDTDIEKRNLNIGLHHRFHCPCFSVAFRKDDDPPDHCIVDHLQIWKLRLSTSRKLGVTGIFLLGSL